MYHSTARLSGTLLREVRPQFPGGSGGVHAVLDERMRRECGHRRA